ncbi:MAG: acetoacetate--CoA ligase [Methylococcales bacterium]|nr:acetoacetate--CoA ligase [Methylococcales bacterium]MBT4598608.1 acetoacetate--CoA ligase [Methylococcales bacterium]MBT6251169.1 acetoacetate--CoA ligase [Nitrosomonadales bacterium]MBT6794575.1 acetoacetate--CoA ligase [Methylococcales bacterium]MBT7968134.1 acetoacetate--CoA ligase [Methylococcales bacterium]
MNKVLWRPSTARQKNANITHFMTWVRNRYGIDVSEYNQLYQWSIENSADFWDLFWQFANIRAHKKGNVTLSHADKMPGAQWFPGTRLNYAENLLNHRNSHSSSIIFHGENGTTRHISSTGIHQRVSQLAQALRNESVKPGDCIAGVLPNIPETIIAMLATACLGAIWTSCSPDFGVPAIVDRFKQIKPKVLFVSDGYYFNGKEFDRLDQIIPLVKALPSIQKTILIPYINRENLTINIPLSLWSHYLSSFSESLPIAYEPMKFDAPLFILYSSGTTGPPKCIVHSVGGTLIQHLKEHLLHVDIHPGDRLFFYTTCGWMMWNWLVSGLASGARLILYDGSPLYPNADSLFDLIDEFKINFFGVSAKYLNVIQKRGVIPKKTHDLSSLSTILSTGSPLAAEGFDFVYNSIKSDICLSSISGGTDIISCFVLGSPILPVRRGEIQCRGLGMDVDVFDENGHSLKNKKGELVCKKPFPSMPISFWDDFEQNQYRAAYFEKYAGVWWHGDYVALMESGGMIIYGRSDTILNPGGVRIGTAEIYRQVEQMGEILESLVVGQEIEEDCRIILFVILRNDMVLSDRLKIKIKQHIRHKSSPRHVPAEIFQVTAIPHTKNGKIAEMAVHNIIHGHQVKNQSSLSNPEALKQYLHIKELITQKK